MAAWERFKKYLLFFFLLLIPNFFFTMATFYHLKHPNAPYATAVLIAIGFASMEYIVKVPVIRYGHEIAKLSTIEIQVIWVVLTMILAYLVGIWLELRVHPDK
jgi:uncharacterized protein (DUF486 family)